MLSPVHIRKGFFIMGILLTGCSSSYVLTEKQLRSELIDNTLVGHHEKFYIAEKNMFMYEDLDTKEKSYGTWDIKKIKVDFDSEFSYFCVSYGTTKEHLSENSIWSCMRLKHVEDDLYAAAFIKCTSCKNASWSNHQFIWYRINEENKRLEK
jgi:hypothetical protein